MRRHLPSHRESVGRTMAGQLTSPPPLPQPAFDVASSSSALTHASSSEEAAPDNTSLAAAPPTRPSAHAACPRTSGSGSASARIEGDRLRAILYRCPQLPSATQTFRANPALPARRIAEPRLKASQASGSSAISRSATSDGASVPG
jgi:hypothetical protein